MKISLDKFDLEFQFQIFKIETCGGYLYDSPHWDFGEIDEFRFNLLMVICRRKSKFIVFEYSDQCGDFLVIFFSIFS